MTVADEIQSAVKTDHVILGYRETIKFLKAGGKMRYIVIAKNIPEQMSSEIKQNAKVADAKLEVFEGSSKDLGTACGKPFPVAAMVVKG